MDTTTVTRATVRPLRPGEVATLHAVFAQLSPRSAFLRYHTGMPRLPARMARALATVVPGEHEVFVAEVRGRPVGVARWVRDPVDPGVVEVAVEVADAQQGRGVGRLLLRAVAASAHRAGVREVQAHVHPGNAVVLAWLRRLGAEPPAAPESPHRVAVLGHRPGTVVA